MNIELTLVMWEAAPFGHLAYNVQVYTSGERKKEGKKQ